MPSSDHARTEANVVGTCQEIDTPLTQSGFRSVRYSPLDLAKTIAGMSYSELLKVARELVDMNAAADADRDVGTKHGMAETLADWAESVVVGEACRQGGVTAAKAA
jgi:hypothetical protein